MSTFYFERIPELERRKLFEMARVNKVTPELLVAHIIHQWFFLQDCANGKPTVEVILPVSGNTQTIALWSDTVAPAESAA